MLLFCLAVFALVFAVGYLPFLYQFVSQPTILHRMTSLAAGFLISAALLVALPEGLHLYLDSTAHQESKLLSSGVRAGFAVLAGFLFMLMLEGFGFGHDVHEQHHEYVADHNQAHLYHPVGSAKSVAVGLSIHSITDGLAIGAALSLSELGLSLQLALAILMHKFPAAFSLSAYSLHERHDRRVSLLYLTLFSLSTPLAILVSALGFSELSEPVIALILLFSSGCFIYVATVDVLPHMHYRGKSRETLGMVVTGMVLMALGVLLMASLIPDGGHHMPESL